MMPLAVKVKNRINGKRAQRRRALLITRQKNKCHWCGLPMTPAKQQGDGNPRHSSATIEHLVPLQDGGTNHLFNTVAVHYSCNQARNTERQKNENVQTSLG